MSVAGAADLSRGCHTVLYCSEAVWLTWDWYIIQHRLRYVAFPPFYYTNAYATPSLVCTSSQSKPGFGVRWVITAALDVHPSVIIWLLRRLPATGAAARRLQTSINQITQIQITIISPTLPNLRSPHVPLRLMCIRHHESQIQTWFSLF